MNNCFDCHAGTGQYKPAIPLAFPLEFSVDNPIHNACSKAESGLSSILNTDVRDARGRRRCKDANGGRPSPGSRPILAVHRTLFERQLSVPPEFWFGSAL